MKNISYENGISVIEVESWHEYLSFINDNLKYNHFVWRGQTDSSWLLEPTIDRMLKRKGKVNSDYILNSHLTNFKYSVRGRRGSSPPILGDDNDWWALGQHNGLVTPLLDWTKSPFVASFFALASSLVPESGYVAVFGISQSSIHEKSKEIENSFKGKGRAPMVEFIEPLSDENSRLVSQSALFSRSPNNVDIESWVNLNFNGHSATIKMWKILIPYSDREKALRSLNRMNINHASLFPDLYGASKFTNFDIEIDNY